ESLVLRTGRFRCPRLARAPLRIPSQTVQDVGRRPNEALLLPDRGDDRHSLVVATNFASPGGVAPDRARLGDLAFLARRIPQRLGAHRHPFAVCRHHLQGVRAESIVRRRLAPGVELLEVPRRADRERLTLALGHVPRRGAVAPVPSPALLPAREPPTRLAVAYSAPPGAPPPAACPGNPGTH